MLPVPFYNGIHSPVDGGTVVNKLKWSLRRYSYDITAFTLYDLSWKLMLKCYIILLE